MNTTGSEKELKKMMKGISLESPGPDFSSKVMHAVLNGEKKKLVFGHEPLLGKSFWILVTLFVALAVILVLLSGNDHVSNIGAIQDFFNKLPWPEWYRLKTQISSLPDVAGSLPGILAVVMTGASVLILADKFLAGKFIISGDGLEK